jgi:hypothetical protein
MLREHPARTPEGGLHRRWFSDELFDLYVWSDDAGEIARFQLCYGKPECEHALTWSPDGLAHDRVDAGDDDPTKNRTPVLLPDGDVPWTHVRARFRDESAAVPLAVRRFILDALGATPDELAGLREAAPARADAAAASSTPRGALARGGRVAIAIAALVAVGLAAGLGLRTWMGRPVRSAEWRGIVFDLPRRSEHGVWLFTVIADSGAQIVVLADQPAGDLRRGDPITVTGAVSDAGDSDVVLRYATFSRPDGPERGEDATRR